MIIGVMIDQAGNIAGAANHMPLAGGAMAIGQRGDMRRSEEVKT